MVVATIVSRQNLGSREWTCIREAATDGQTATITPVLSASRGRAIVLNLTLDQHDQ